MVSIDIEYWVCELKVLFYKDSYRYLVIVWLCGKKKYVDNLLMF